jgi:hypothetical protein
VLEWLAIWNCRALTPLSSHPPLSPSFKKLPVVLAEALEIDFRQNVLAGLFNPPYRVTHTNINKRITSLIKIK